MHTKQLIETLKSNNLPQLYKALHPENQKQDILFVLENLGHLPKDFNGDCLIPLISSESTQIRFWTVKNLGKLRNHKYLESLFIIAKNDPDSMVRREAISSIGRMRNKQTKSLLIELLGDADPKAVLQAIRGLLVFKHDSDVKSVLQTLRDHPNETIQAVIAKEFPVQKNSPSTVYSHVASPDFMKNVVVSGDVCDTLLLVPDESIHLTFTSPPYYNARDYSIYESYQAYLSFLTDVFREVHRVTKEGRFLVVNTSPVIVPRVSRSHSSKRYPIPFDIHARLTEIGWEFIDDIVWAKPEASVKNRNAGFLQHRKPLGYKPNPVTEYLMVYRKQTDKLLDWNMHQYPPEIVNRSKVQDGYETSNLWRIDPTFDRVHTAVFPIELCKRVISYYSYEGDLIFDPFAGSGTVGKAAQELQRYYFLTEKEPTYFERIQQSLGQRILFHKVRPRFLDLGQFRQLRGSNS